ncbi:MAG: T9SS type A sorting domain-containing protein [Ferruginibacter sp.]
MKKIFTAFLGLVPFIAVAQLPFTPGNIVVYRAGDGSGALSNAATAVVLVEYSPTGTLVQSIPMPTSNGVNKALTCAGNATAEGLMTRSQDGKYLMVPGYAANVGTATVATSASATVNRVVARLDATGAVNTTTALNDAFNNSNIRGAASSNGTDIWMSNNGTGVRYTTFGSTTSTIISNSPTTLRSVYVYSNQLFVGTANMKVATVGTGLTTVGSGDVAVGLPGLDPSGAYQFFFADLNAAIPGDDVLYVADDAASPNGGIQKYSFDGTNWNSNGVLVPPAVIKGLAAYVNGTTVTLFSSNPTNIYSTTDASGYNATITGSFTSIATAPANTAFRGLAPAPLATSIPLNLLSFKAFLTDKNVQLSWTTANEQNVRSYNIERSSDGRNFSLIGTVAAKNTSSAEYTFTDIAVLSGAGYYRLKMIDLDGTVKLSNVILINNRKGITTRIFPNPVLDNVNVSHDRAGNNASIKIMDVAGRQLNLFAVPPGAVQSSLPVNQLKPGQYLLSYENNGVSAITKFVKN